MKKTFKKITAALMAVTSLAVGMVGMSANAATGTRNLQYYSSRYIGGGAPGSASYTDVCKLYATNAEYYGYCSTLDLTGTYGTVTIECINYDSKPLIISQPKKGDKLKISGNLNQGYAQFSCSCYGNHTVYSKGYVKINS